MLRVGIYVDITNQFRSLSTKKKGCKVNYGRYLDRFVSDHEKLVFSNAYGSQVNTEANGFIAALRQLGYLTKFMYADKVGEDIIQPNRNVEIAVDIMGAVDKLDIVVLGSNDADLIPLIKHLQHRGIKVVVASPVLTHNEGNVNIDLANTDLVESIQEMRERKK